MLKRALGIDIKGKYLLMDSLFLAPSIIANLWQHIHIICMLKDQPKWFYQYNGKKLRLSDLYSKLKKTAGRPK
jgi:hypothetical protein